MTGDLSVSLAGERDLITTRSFAAPRTLVFDCLTKPGLLKLWQSPPGWDMPVCEIDLRVGGRYYYVWRQPGGREVGQFGEYRELEPPSRIVDTQNWDDWNPGEVLSTSTLTEAGGRTVLEVRMLFPSAGVRETLVKHGMTDNTAAIYDRLDGVLAEMHSR